jgi:hypothetical protein
MVVGTKGIMQKEEDTNSLLVGGAKCKSFLESCGTYP